MPAIDPRVDEYLRKAKPFAQPILSHLRALIHDACPDCVETIKWGMPAFDHKGPICTIAGFKGHCVLAFWKAPLLEDPHGVLESTKRSAMGHLGRITALGDLPRDAALRALVRQAAKLNEAGVKVAAKRTKKPPVRVATFVLAAIKRDRAALTTWKAFAPSHRREYVEWITEAKTEATREKRLAQMLTWLAEGKQRNWKYQR